MPGITNDDHGRGPAERMFSWRSARACAVNGCLQAATTPDGVALRDSKTPDILVRISRQDWVDFVAAMKAGEFDGL